MPRTERLTRRFPVATSDAAHRQLRRFADRTGLDPDRALTFILENLGDLEQEVRFQHRLQLYVARHGQTAGD